MSSLERRVRELRSCFALFIYLYLYRICPFNKADFNRGPDKWLNTSEYVGIQPNMKWQNELYSKIFTE